MPARTSAKTHKRHRPKSRVKPRKSKPRKRTARKNGKREKPTRRRRVRGGGPKPKADGKATGSETDPDSETETITLEQLLEELEHAYKYSEESREQIQKDLKGYDNSTRAGRKRIKSYYEDIQERIEGHINKYLSDQHAEELKDIKKEHEEETDKFSAMWRNPTSRANESYAAEAWENAEVDQRAANIMIENSHRAEHARMDEMIIKRWDKGWRQAVEDYKPPVAAAGAGVQRTLTQILSEDYPIPVAAHTMSNGFFEDDHLHARGMIEEWDAAWDEADKEEYKASVEYTRDQERKRKEDAKKANEEQKRKQTEDANEAERARIAALPPREDRKAAMRRRMKENAMKLAGQWPPAPPPAPPAAPPPAPPAAPPPAPPVAPVTQAEADAMVAANPNLSIAESRTYPGRFYVSDLMSDTRIWILK